MGPRTRHGGLFALPAAPTLPLLLPDRCALAEPPALLKGKLGRDRCRLRDREHWHSLGFQSILSLRASREFRLQVAGTGQTWG